MTERRNAFARHRGAIAVEQTEDGLFVFLDGVKVARRNHTAWVPLRQGYTVHDLPGGKEVELKLNGSKVLQQL
jgi:hypothetical protein